MGGANHQIQIFFSSGNRYKAIVTDVLFDGVKDLSFKYNGEPQEIIGYLLR